MTGDVEVILDAVATAAPEIRAALPGRREAADETNPSGETVMAADAYADELLCERLTALDAVGAYASEERPDVVDAGEGYSLAVDPLDGSSNLKSNNPMGTVVGVYDAPLPARGRDLVAATFVLYGPITTMVAAVDGDATEYVVEGMRSGGEPRAGERREVGAVELPDEPTVYGFGGRVPDWPDDVHDYVRDVEDELKLRYGGAMIADVSQVLTYGGIFAYPTLRSRSEGKLRLLFEGAPIGYLVEAAGGRSSDGERSLLDVEAGDLHQRTPVYVGNAGLIDRLERTLGDAP